MPVSAVPFRKSNIRRCSVLIFRRIGWSAEDYEAWSARLLAEGYAFVTPSTHRGEPCTRFAIVNPRTTVSDLTGILATMA